MTFLGQLLWVLPRPTHTKLRKYGERKTFHFCNAPEFFGFGFLSMEKCKGCHFSTISPWARGVKNTVIVWWHPVPSYHFPPWAYIPLFPVVKKICVKVIRLKGTAHSKNENLYFLAKKWNATNLLSYEALWEKESY